MNAENEYIQELASQVIEIARSSRMSAIKKRWRDVIALRKPDRPPVWCNPVACWSELLPEDTLICRDPVRRELEQYFKRLLIKNAIGDDTPMNDYYMVNTVLSVEPGNMWGVDIRHEASATVGGAWRYQPPLVTSADFDRLAVPQYRVDTAATAAARAAREEVLGDAMPVRTSPVVGYFSPATLCQPAAELRGMEPMMMDMIDDPGLAHRLMGTIQRGVMARLDAIEQSGVEILPNTDGPMFLSDPLRADAVGSHGLRDCWAHGNSQEFDLVSPEMFDEFLLAYQKPVFARFGAVCYGCCENLTRKLDLVLTIPNLRLLTCSAWTDLPTLVDKVQNRCCIMWRHKASDVVCPDDISELKRKIFMQAEMLRGCSYQVVLRELQTLMGHQERLREWTLLSIEAVSR